MNTDNDNSEARPKHDLVEYAYGLLTGLAEGTGDMVALLDADFHCLLFNDAYGKEFERLWGIDLETGASMVEVLTPWPEQQQKARALWERALRGESFSVRSEFGPADGRKQIYENTFSPVVGANNEPVAAVHIARDVTERLRTEQALLASQERYRRLFEDDLTGDFSCTPEGEILLCNPAFARIFGWSSAAEPLGTSMLDLYIDPRERASLVETLQRDGKIEQFGVWRKRRDGRQIFIVENLIGHFDAQGRLCEIRGYVLDDTQRQQAEEGLRKSESRLQTAMDHLGEGVVIANKAGDLIYWNPAARAMHELADPKDLYQPVGDFTAIFQLWTPDSKRMLPLEEWPMVRIARGESLRNVELRIRRPDRGWDRIVSYSGDILETVAGERLIYLSMYDLTEQRQAEEALRESEQQFRTLADTITNLAWWANGDGYITWYNRRWYEYTGTTPEQMEGWGWQSVHDPQVLPTVMQRWKASIAMGEPFEMTFPLRGADGVFRSFLTRIQPVKDAQGRVVRWFGTNTDVDELKRTQEALLQSEERLRRLNESLEQQVQERTAELASTNRELKFRAEQLSRLASELTLTEQRERHRIAKVLHDHLQQLLVATKLSVEELVTGGLTREAIHQIQNLLNESIAVSRSLTVELSPTILHEAGLPAGLEWLARWMDKQHGLIVELDLQRDAVTGREDIRILLFESVRELLFNIVKHADTNRAKVSLTRSDAYLEIVVSDAGAGFDPEHLQGRHGSAGGFGLFSIRERLELLGGSLQIESTPGGGARFVLRAPVTYRERQVVLKMEQVKAAAQHEQAAIEAAAGSLLRVLIVDDHKVLRQGMAARLKRESDIEIVGEAGDGQEAIDKAHQLRPHVILMDFSMPRMDGVEATQRITAELPGIRIIGLSMYEEADRANAMLRAGAARYVTKSAEFDELLTAIRTAHTAA